VITSPANERIKKIRKLQDRKGRGETGLFFIEGLRIVTEALQQGAQVESLVVCPDLLKSVFARDLVKDCDSRGIEIMEVGEEVFKRLSSKEGPQGLAAVVQQRWSSLGDLNFRNPSSQASHTWVALDAIADPGNLGTILRTHDGVGGEGVILLDQSTDPFDPSCSRASMGALFTQRLIKSDFAPFAQLKRRTGIPVIGTSGAADMDYTTVRYPPQFILLMGSERQGLLEHHLELCDQVVSIPMLGKSDSLNLAVATAVVLYEVFNQRRREP